MYDHEKTDSKIDNDNKIEIAETCQCTKADVEDVMQKHRQLQNFHQWLCNRKASGDHMPESRDELMQIYKIERPAFLVPSQHKKTYSQKVSKYAGRRHYT